MVTFDDSQSQYEVGAQQLEQQFSQAWHVAIAVPENASLSELWQLLEPYLYDLSNTEQLQLAAKVIAQLAELHTLKADRLLGDWQDVYSDEGPMMELDLLQGLVQRTMYLDLTDLVRAKEKRTRMSSNQSVVGTVDKKKVLEMVEAIESEETLKQTALNVSHDENVSAWVNLISEWLQQQKRTVSLPELVCGVDLPLVKVWLALLLGNYLLESRGEFYAGDQIWIQGKA